MQLHYDSMHIGPSRATLEVNPRKGLHLLRHGLLNPPKAVVILYRKAVR